MPTDLHTLLADELGVSPSEAEHALSDLLSDVKARAQQGEDVSLQGLGTFSMDEGTLHFSPSPHLQKAVNYRNEQLAPMTVGAPRERPADRPEPADAPPPLEEPPDDAFAAVEAAPEDEPPPEEPEPWNEPPEAAEPTEPPAEEAPALSDDWTEELAEEDAAAASSDTASTAQIAGLVASVGLLALLLWVVLGMQGIVSGPGSLFQSAASDAADADPVTETTTAATGDASDEDAASDTAEAASSADAARPDEGSGMPPTIDRSAGGWTIVVASRTRPQDAERVLEAFQQRFQGSDVPVDILTGSSGGQVRYRIAVGQYDSRAAVQAGLRSLQDRLPGDAWPLRIQPNS